MLIFAATPWVLYGLLHLFRFFLILYGIGIKDAQPFSGITYLLVFIFGPICVTGGYLGLNMLFLKQLLDEKEESLTAANRLAAEYRELSDHDSLTQALNNRSFMENLHKEIERATRSGSPLCVIMADLDHFKHVNDVHGHAAGDKVLREVVALWSMLLRSPDLLGRVGGEEFAIILPQTHLSQGMLVAERLRSAMQPPESGLSYPISASFGVAELRSGEVADSVLKRADLAMYSSKHAGRNCVSAA